MLTPVELDEQAIWHAQDVCAYFRISRNSLYREIREGLPHCKIGGIYKFEKNKVKRWFLERYRIT